MRYTAHGTLDPSFGNSGVFSSSFEFQPPVYRLGGPTYHYESPAVEATGVAVDSTDRPVLTGTAVTRMAGCRDIAYGSVPFHESFVARLTTEGKPDPTFNGTGVRPDEAQFSAEAPVAGSSNAVVYLRSVGNECGNLGGNAQTEGVGELTAAGLPNPAFGPDEVGGFQDAAAIAIDRRGRIVLLRDQYNWEGVLKGPMVQVVRLLPNGSADASFGRRGTATFRSKGFVFNAIATEGHQRVLLAGDRDEKNRVSLGVFRLRPNGSPEGRFGHRGRAIILLGKRQGVEPSPIGVRIAVDRRERVLVGQYWNWTGHSGSHFAVARFMP
jgi:uncharacterized delta-60 repeat protein